MLESTGKISASALTSTATLMGSFDECLSVTSHSDTAKTDDLDNNHVFRGQYCTLILFQDNKATVSILLRTCFERFSVCKSPPQPAVT